MQLADLKEVARARIGAQLDDCFGLLESVAYIVEYRTSEAGDWQRQGRIFEGPRARECAESVRDMAQEVAPDGEARIVPLYR